MKKNALSGVNELMLPKIRTLEIAEKKKILLKVDTRAFFLYNLTFCYLKILFPNETQLPQVYSKILLRSG